MDLPIKNGDFPVRYVNLPEGHTLRKQLKHPVLLALHATPLRHAPALARLMLLAEGHLQQQLSGQTVPSRAGKVALISYNLLYSISKKPFYTYHMSQMYLYHAKNIFIYIYCLRVLHYICMNFVSCITCMRHYLMFIRYI